jgi:hypothetical protein
VLPGFRTGYLTERNIRDLHEEACRHDR